MSNVPSTSSSTTSILTYLHSIYRFVDKPASDDQTKNSIDWIIDLFKNFKSTLSCCDHTASMFQLNKTDLSAFRSSMMHMSSVRWYPEYASAILTLESSIQGDEDIALVGCDQWKFSTRLLPGGRSEHVADSEDYLESSCGSLLIEKRADCFVKVDMRLQKRVAREARSAANGKGHQMTPAFLRSVVIDVIAKLGDDSESDARGATTDVGMHTGSRRRCTTWPLFLAVLDRCITRNNNAPLLPSKILMHFDLYAFDTVMKCFSGADTPSIEQLDMLFHILSSASERALQLSALAMRHALRSDLSVIKEMICSRRRELDRYYSDFCERINHRYTIDSFECHPRPLQLLYPTIVKAADNVYCEDRVLRNVLLNIGLIDGFKLGTPLKSVTFCSLLIYLESDNFRDAMKHPIRAALLLKTIEAVFYQKAALLDMAIVQMTTDELEYIDRIINKYSSILDEWIGVRDWQGSWFVDLRSVEMVVHWIACCLVHKSLCMTYPLLNEYNIPLNYRDMKHLVLTEGESIDAAILVAGYLRKNNQNPSNEIFNPEKQSPTIDFASRFAMSDRAMLDSYNKEVIHREAEKVTYMTQINERKKELQNLRSEKSSEEVILRKLQSRSNEVDVKYNSTQYRTLQRDISSSRAKITQLENQITVANRAPAFIKSPLPSSQREALVVLFFLQMPTVINLWCKMLIASKSMLLQRGKKTRFDAYPLFLASIKNPTVDLSWASYFKSIRTSTTVGDRNMIYFPNLKVPNTFGHSLVDVIVSAQIWYPDASSRFITNTSYNPFLATEQWTSRIYTETIDSKVDFCLWNPVHPAGPSSRGNDPYAAYYSLPLDLSKSQQIAVASLRSYPHAQMRKLAIMLRDTSIPIDNKVTATAIRMALFNIGDLSDKDKPKQLLRRDIELGASESIYNSLQKWRDIITNNKVHIGKMEILSDISFLMSHESAAFQDLSMEFCQVAEQWLKANFDELKKDSITADQIESIVIDNVRLLAYALLSLPLHKSGLRNAAVSMKALSLLTMFYNGFSSKVFVKDIAQMRMKMLSRICGCSRSLFENVSASMNAHLTAAIRRVIESCPPSLPWRAINGFCYQASLKGKVSYSINILDGCVLLDGFPLGLLPSSIVTHDLYKRTFGQNNFKVGLMAGIFRTNIQIKGKYYEFSMAANDIDLVVKELVIIDGVVQSSLLLIDYHACSSWPSDLPVRLKEMYSHWYNSTDKCLYIRPIAFQDRLVYGVIAFGESATYSIPRPLDKSIFDIKEMRHSNDRFVALKHDSQVLNALIKFEDRRYIHILQESITRCIKYHLSRYGLSFRITVDNGSAVSLDMTEYKLSSSQQIAELLPHFTDYLILEPVQPESLLNWVVLIPDGIVGMVNGMPKVVVSPKYDDSIGYFKYQVHRLLKHLMHDSILSGLHLSAIYAAAGSLLPDIRMKMTGSEAALGILRQCLVNRPYTREESVKMQTVCRLGWREPTLVTLCSKYIDFSQQLRFLYDYGASDHVITSSEYFNDARSSSKLIAINEYHRNFRKELVDAEYTEIHGVNMTIKPAIVQDGSSIVRRRNFSEDFVIVNSCKFKSQNVKSVAFPVDAMSGVGMMEQEMYDELKSSYDLFLKTPVSALDPAVNYSQWLIAIADKLPEIIRRNETAICEELSTTKAYSSEFAILVASNRAPIVTRSDLLKIALDKNISFKFNPSIEDIEQLHGAILRLLELFVLEETLSRAREYLEGRDDKLFIQELDNLNRDWDSAANVDWLVFEVEGRLQIRSKQYLVAQHLIDSPGSICQLNMGEGKTRVILPMLIMYYTRSRDRSIYVNLLRQILLEARDYLQRYLSFSQLHIVTLELPFQRDVALTGKRVRIMDSMLSLARRYRCFITVSPESRLSMMLNSIEVDYECRCKVEYGSLLNSFLQKMKAAVNIFDESDRLLSHIFQLVYTAGDVSPLSDLEARMVVVQALLKAVNGDAIKSILTSDGFAAIEERKHVGFSIGAFTSIRLYDANTDELLSRRELFKRELLQAIIRHPLRELQWMQHTKQKNVIESLVFDQDVDMYSRELFSDMQWAQLTCLRGFLGGGLFEYALSLRESVTFGIDERRQKRIAVPYQAADLPTEKSEYSNPDLTLFLTSIAYYAKGLSKNQLIDSFRLLLKSNPSEQDQRYKSWIASIAIGLDASELKMIGSVGMIDLNHPVQLSLLYQKFRYHVEVINFWLEKDVFPRDTAQYDKRIVGSAFDVAAGDHSIGFSGTKDNHRLIPWQVKQNEPDIDSLLATDGMMLYKIVDNTLSHVTLGASKQTCVELLDSVLDLNADALIDTGALLVGISNEAAAIYLVDKSSFKHRGVYYFKDMWMVMDKETRQSTEASRSSITSRESLIIYDEARTRGVDLKSKRDAVAVVTLGPKLMKANFMQGVGRLRAFGNRQKIVIVMTKEIEREIVHVEGRDGCRHSSVLRWIMLNTVDFSTLGLVTYSKNAIQFAKSSDDRKNSVVDEDWTLEPLYSKGRRSEALVDIVRSASTGVSTHFKNRILDQVIRYGSEHIVSSVSSNNDQCEREMQIEEQEQQEVEVERAPIVALHEATWSYNLISNIRSVAQLPVTIISFAEKLRSINHLLSSAKWPLNLYATSNYFNCINNVKDVRLIDAILVFSDCVVVLSDMESDGILGALHDRPNPSIGYVNLRDLEVVTGSPQMALGRVNMANEHSLSTAMKLFNGDVNYGSALSAEINRLCPKAVEKAVVEHVNIRGNSRFWKFSELEEIFDRMNY